MSDKDERTGCDPGGGEHCEGRPASETSPAQEEPRGADAESAPVEGEGRHDAEESEGSSAAEAAGAAPGQAGPFRPAPDEGVSGQRGPAQPGAPWWGWGPSTPPPYYTPYGGPPPGQAWGKPPRTGRSWMAWTAGGCLVLVLAVLALIGVGARVAESTGPGEKIGVLYIDGPIVGGQGDSLFFGTSATSDRIVREIDRARRDKSIRALILRINSPGGSAAASQEIYQEVMRFRKGENGERKPVIASMADVAASGGYYVAAAADKIVANGATMTGSIGVIMEMQNLSGLFQKLGVSNDTIKSGQYKDTGSMFRPMRPAERRLLQALVDDVYEQFVSAVIAGRKQADPAQIRRLADGRVFTGRQALKLKLVDALGNFQDAVALAAREAGIEGPPVVVELGRQTWFESFFGRGSNWESRLGLPGEVGEGERFLRLLRQLAARAEVPR
ncbi:MAG: signal peptide peptidase SppA [Armatimonadota bacterium]|nr:signal peptide peptidase SppA [Armatimonadota bacterium]